MQVNNPRETSSDNPHAETVSELTHRHLVNQHHVTTDEEIRNVDLELDKITPEEAEEINRTPGVSTSEMDGDKPAENAV